MDETAIYQVFGLDLSVSQILLVVVIAVGMPIGTPVMDRLAKI